MQREHQDSGYTPRETTRQVGVGPKQESNSEEGRCNTIHIFVRDAFRFGKRQIRPSRKPQNIWPRRQANRENSSISTEAWSTHGILSARPKLQDDSDDKNTLTKTHSSWTASSLAIQSRKNTTELVSTGNRTVISGSTLERLTALREGAVEFYASGEKRSSWTIPEIYIRGPRISNVS